MAKSAFYRFTDWLENSLKSKLFLVSVFSVLVQFRVKKKNGQKVVGVATVWLTGRGLSIKTGVLGGGLSPCDSAHLNNRVIKNTKQ